MTSAQDALYQLHLLEAARFGHVPVPYDRFCARLQKSADITGMLLPPSALNIKIQAEEERSFNPTRLYITSNAAAAVPVDEVRQAIERHAAGDGGLLGEKDWRQNDNALRDGGRLFSVYTASSGRKFCRPATFGDSDQDSPTRLGSDAPGPRGATRTRADFGRSSADTGFPKEVALAVGPAAMRGEVEGCVLSGRTKTACGKLPRGMDR